MSIAVLDTDVPETDSPPLIEMSGMEKRFGRVVALDDVDFELRQGEIMGLLGDNGSGKSTLVKCLVGVHQPEAGVTHVRGERVRISSPQEARKHGIATVFQDLALVDELTVATNMFLARYPKKRLLGLLPIIDWDYMNEEAERILRERMNIEIDPTSRVEFLSGGERQAIAIARSLVTEPDIIVMDEPTSALSPDSAHRVEELIQTLNQEEDISIVIISHNLNEVFSLTDRITVIDNGSLIDVVDTDEVTRADIVKMMTGDIRNDEVTEGDSETEEAAVTE